MLARSAPPACVGAQAPGSIGATAIFPPENRVDGLFTLPADNVLLGPNIMSEKPEVSRNTVSGGGSPHASAHKGGRPRGRLTHNRRKQIILLAFLGTIGAGMAVLLASKFPAHSLLTEMRDSKSADEYRTGTIVLNQPDSNGCRRRIFDNNNGGMSITEHSCAMAPIESGGTPSARGTIQRLDAINKSFSNR
jgi:hypothetical protein